MSDVYQHSNDGDSGLQAGALLDGLREKLQGAGAADALAMLDRFATSLERMEAELDGMTCELLTVYEQLGTVFEVCKKLSTVKTEDEVVDLFLEKLGHTFSGRTVVAAYPSDEPHPSDEAHSSDESSYKTRRHRLKLPPCLSPIIDQARQNGKAIVESNAAGLLTPEITAVLVSPVYSQENFVCAIVVVRGATGAEFQASDMGLADSLATFCGDLVCNHRLVYELRSMSVSMVRSLVNAVDQKDQYTCGHSLRVGYYATLLGRRLGLCGTDLQMLQWSALLHDVGKIGIRDDVLKKTGKLTDEEFNHIKEHPVRSYEVVRGVPQLKDALAGVLYHHEHYDGSGYPEGLVGEEIPLQARIIQIADIFDALTSRRSYRKAFDWRKALTILAEEASTTVDPNLGRIFDAMMRARLESDPRVWDRMIVEATSFTQDLQEPMPIEI